MDDNSAASELVTILDDEQSDEELAHHSTADTNDVIVDDLGEGCEQRYTFEFRSTRVRHLFCCGNERIWAAVLSVVVASVPALLFGCTLGFPSPVLLELMEPDKQEFRFDTLLSDLFSAMGLVGGIIGGPPAGFVSDRYGRKVSIVISGLLFGAGYTIIAFAKVKSLNPQAFKSFLMIGRLVTGIGSGWSFVSTPVYCAEISSPRLRGILTSFAELSLSAGIFFVYVLGSIMDFAYFEISLVMLGIVFFFLVTVLWIPETPIWLLLKHKNREKVIKVLTCLRGSKYRCLDSEMKGIESAIEKTDSTQSITQIIKEFKKSSILIPFLILLVLMVFQELCGGGTTVTTYAAPIFKEAGVENPLVSSSYAIGGSQLFATFVSVCIIDCVGRKVLLIISFFGMFVASTMLGTHFFVTRPSLCEGISTSNVSFEDATGVCNSHFAPLAIVSLIFFMMSFAIGLGPVLWTLMSEYLPLHVRGFASGVVILANWVAGAIVTGVYLSYANLVKPWFAWWTFSLINLGGMVFVLIFIMETKGKSLETIQETFMDHIRFCPRRRVSYTTDELLNNLDDGEDDVD